MQGSKDHLIVQFLLKRVSGEVCLNGIPVWSAPDVVDDTDQSIQINAYVVPGMNRLDLVLDIDGPPSACRSLRRRKADKDAFAMVRVIRFPPGEVFPFPKFGTVLASREWEGDKDESEECPRFVSLTFDAGAGFGNWSWQAAPKITLDQATLEETRVLCEAVRSAIRKGDARELLRLGEIRFREVGEAFGATSDAEDIAQLERWVAQFAAEPDRVLPIDPRKFDLRLVGDDKILLPYNQDWSHVVRMRVAVTDQDDKPAGEIEIPYAIMLARVGKGLAIVR